MDKIIEVKNLVTSYYTKTERVQAVQDISFYVNKGETFCLVGESGCGKSATCRSILRLIQLPGKITNGQVIYKGTDLLKLSEKEMIKYRGKEIAMIFQDPMTALNPVLTIKEQIQEAFKEKNLTNEQKEEKVIELLKLVGIPSPKQRLKEYSHQFSGGMKQRAMIAAALASNPNLLIADEPTTALDVTIQDQIIKLINKLKKELDMSIILVTHDMGVVAQMCNRVAIMYAGKIMEMADTVSLFGKPRHPYTLGLLKSIPCIGKSGEKLISIRGNPPDLSDQLRGCPFEPRCNYKEDKCRELLPDLIEIEKGNYSRCHFAEKIKDEKGLIEL